MQVSANPVSEARPKTGASLGGEEAARRARAVGSGDAVVEGLQTWQEAAHRSPRGWGIWSQQPQPAGTERPAPAPGPYAPLGRSDLLLQAALVGLGDVEALRPRAGSPWGPQAYPAPLQGKEPDGHGFPDAKPAL